MTISQTQFAVEQRRRDVAARYLRGQMQSEIAAVYGISRSQVGLDLKVIRAAWLAAAVRDFDAKRAQELAKIDAVEREYWSAWERSKQDKEVTTQEATGAGGKRKRVTLRKEGQAGNPAYLAGVLTCIERRCKILGLDAPTEISGPGGAPIAVRLFIDALEHIYADDADDNALTASA